MRKIVFVLGLLAASLGASAQVDLTATAGTLSQSYTTLKAAFDAINLGTHTGTIAIGLSGNTTETATALLNNSGTGAASYSAITISPSGGAARSISGGIAAGSPLIDLSGADNVTIDGLNTGGNTLTIENTTASASSGTSTIRFIGGATNNTITNCSIKGAFSATVTTLGGNIFFSTDAVTASGNDNNTISNCNIGPSGTNLPTKCIYGNGSTSTTAIGNSGISITNNNIFDYFGTTVTSAGIYTGGGCNNWSITNNRFYQTATRTWTIGAQHSAIWLLSSIATSGMQGATVTGNTIGYASSTQTGTYTLTGSVGKFIGIYLTAVAGGSTNTISSNTIASVNLSGVTSIGTTTLSPFAGILENSGSTVISSNTIGSQSATGSLVFSTNTASSTDVYGIYYAGSDAWTSNSNTIGGLSATNAAASGTFSVYGMRGGLTNTWTASSNTIGGPVAGSIALVATASASTIYGMYNNNSPGSLTANTVCNLTSSAGSGPVYGIYNGTPSFVHTLSRNNVYALSNTGAGAASVYGILFSGAAGSVVERNTIHSLNTSTTGGTLIGLYIFGGTSNEYRNNMVRLGLDANGASVADNMVIRGIYDQAGTNINFYHNSIYIGGTSASGINSTYCVNISSFVTISANNTRNYRNNIFYNARSNTSSTGRHYAMGIFPPTIYPANAPGLTLDNNDYYAPGTGGLFGSFNNADVANLSAWQTAVGMDANSLSADPLFKVPDGTSATGDLHILSTSPAKIKGVPLSTVTNDYDGQGRSTTAPDMGADQLFVGLSSLAISTGSLSPTFATGTIIYSVSNVPNATTSVTVTPTLVDGTASLQVQVNSGGYSATSNASPSNALALVPGNNTIEIKATATDGTVTIYTITVNRAGITVSGANTGNGSYNTLAAAFTAIGISQTGANIAIDIVGSNTETSTATLGAGTWTSLSIKPSGGGARTISGAMAAGTPLIDLNGADNVTIDGLNTGGNALTFENSTVSATAATSTIRFIAGATNNTITNCSIKGSFAGAVITDGGTVFFSTDAVTGNGNDNNTISNCNIGPSGSNLPTKAIHGNGTTSSTAAGNSGISIANNNIFDYFGPAVTSAGIYTLDGCNTWRISNNRFYQTGTRTWTTGAQHSAIWLLSTSATSGMQGAALTGNTIGYSGSTQAGTYALTGSNGKLVAIVVAAPTGGAVNTISGNTIASISLTGVTSSGMATASPFTAIMVTNGVAVISSNTIGSQSATGSLSFSTNASPATEVQAIYMGGTNAVVSSSNSIGGLLVTNAATSGTNFIFGLRQQGSGAWTASSNTIGGTVSNSIQLSTATSGSSFMYGMYTIAATGPLLLSSNTIRNLTSNALGIMEGIAINAGSAVNTFSQNTVYAMSATSAGAPTVIGIEFNGLAGSVTESNLVHSLSVASTGILYGMYLSNGTATNKNNMVRLGLDATGASITNAATIYGIYEIAGTNSFYNNSIYIGGTGVVTATASSYAFYSATTSNTRSFRNNIFQNARSNASGTGKHYAITVAGTGTNPTGLTIDYNDYYVSGTGGVFGLYNGADVANLAAWKTAVGQDAHSLSADPQFLVPNGTTATLDLHIAPTSPVKGNGISIAAVTNDYDGEPRDATVEMGADELNVYLSALTTSVGTLSPVFATGTMTYAVNVPVATTSITVTPTLADPDPAGKVYVQVNTGGYTEVATGNPSGTLSLNAGSNLIEVKAVSVDGLTTTIYSLTVTRSPVTVSGANAGNGFYNTLAAAFTAIGTSQISANIAISIAGNTTETTTATLGAGNWASLSISPSGGFWTIGGAIAAGSPLLNLSGADNVTIDGLNTGGNALIMENSTVSATAGTSTIRFINGATNNTITNCSIKGSSTVSIDGGTIFFASDLITANGNDNNTISNCDIGPSGANLPLAAIYGNGSSGTTQIGNNGITITNNNIFDYFNATSNSWGVYTNNGCNTWSITNNRFYQTGTRTFGSNPFHGAIFLGSAIDPSGMQNATITGNTIGYASSTQTGTYSLTGSAGKFVGIYFNGWGTNNISSNTIASVSLTGVSSSGTSNSGLSPFNGIFITGAATVTVNANTIGSQSATGSLVFSTTNTSATDACAISYTGNGAWTASNNLIGGMSYTNPAATGSHRLMGMYFSGTNSWTVNGNTIGGTVPGSMQFSTSSSTLSSFYGVYTESNGGTVTANTVRNTVINTTNGNLIGLVSANQVSVETISGNTVYGLNSIAASGTTTVYGIYFIGGAGSVVERNLVHSLDNALAGRSLYGILTTSATVELRNNMVRLGVDTSGASITTGLNFFGIYESTSTNNCYNNSIYIGGSNVVTGTANSYAFFSNVPVNTRNYRNNIFHNARSNASGTGKHYAVSIGGTGTNPTGLTMDYNDYYVSGTGGVLGIYNNADVASLAAWQAAVGQDANSLSADPQFKIPDGSRTTLDLHIPLTSAVRTKGTPIGSVTNDYDGDVRNATAPDMGADEAVPLLAAPIISFFGNMTKAVTDLPFTITAPTSNSTGAFSYTSSNAAVATISGSTVTIIGVGTSTITASQAANANYSSGSIAATLTVSNTIVNRYGAVTTDGTNAVNRNGNLGGGTSVDRYGRISTASIAADGLTAGKAATSALAIKQAYPASADGLYWITNPNINSGTPFQVYADMTTDGGGWTLLMCNSNAAGWTYSNALSLNTASPSLSTNYSIVGWADYLKKGASGFQYMIDAGTRGNNGAIWTANAAYSFVSSSNTQTNVTINTKFGTWTYDDNGIEQRMPWYTNCIGILTTSALCNSNNAGSLIATTGGTPAPWITAGCGSEGCLPNPGIIWYWVR